MKKFKFTLQSVYDYKLTVEKTQKADLSAALAALRKLRELERELELAYERNKKSQADVLLRHSADMPSQLAQHDAFFRYLREARAELQARIKSAEAHKERCQNLLVRTMREIKTYTRLKGEQYEEYMREVKAEEEKDMGDMVSYGSIQVDGA